MRSLFSKSLIGLATLTLAIGLPAFVHAQIEGAERGIAPINSAGDFLAEDIRVDTKGKTAHEARQEGWRIAQRLGWSKLWRSMHGGAGAALPDSRLDGIVSAIEIVEEQIGPHNYKARLNVYFDRARTGQILGVSGIKRRSAPLLVIPVQVSGGAEIVFEQRTDWQRAWAQFRTAESVIDYVRPSGAGAESLIINAGQLGRRNRQWWRVILDQFGAADVVMPVVEIDRKYPGGPIVGRFTARAGPDNEKLGGFTLQAKNESGLEKMLEQGVERIDRLYADALARGRLRPDRSLIVEDPVDLEDLEDLPPVDTPSSSDSDSAAGEVELSGGGNASGGGANSAGNSGVGTGGQSPQPQPTPAPDQGPRNILPSGGSSEPPRRLGPRAGPPQPARNAQ